MTRTSCIKHPNYSLFIKIHDWQVTLCEGSVVAAALLSFFEYWHNIKLEMQSKNIRLNDIAESHGDERLHDETTLQFHSEEELINGIQQIGKRDSIRKAINWLESKGFISIHKNPNKRYAFDKTRYFQFHPEIINDLIESLSANNRQSKSKNQRRSSKNQSRSSENASAITKNTSKISYKENIPPTPQGEEGEGEGIEPDWEAIAQSNESWMQEQVETITSLSTEEESIAKPEIQSCRSKEVAQSFDVIEQSNKQDPFYSRRKKPQDQLWDRLPDGDWKDEQGKLNDNFWSWLAKEWMRTYNKSDYHRARSDVLGHFINKPLKLIAEWDAYQAHLQKIQQQAIAIASISPQTQSGEELPIDEERKKSVMEECLKKIQANRK